MSCRLATTEHRSPRRPRLLDHLSLLPRPPRRPRRPIAHRPPWCPPSLGGHHHAKTRASTRRHPRRTGGPGRTLTHRPTPRRLCREPAEAKADRGGVRLDQDGGRPPEDPPSRHGPVRLAVHAHRNRLQPGPSAQAAGDGLTMPGASPRRCCDGLRGGPEKPCRARRSHVTPKEGNQPHGKLISAAC